MESRPAAAVRERREVAPLHLQSQDEAACLRVAAAEEPRVRFNALDLDSRHQGEQREGHQQTGEKKQDKPTNHR